MKLVWSRLTATLGILKIQFEATLSLYRFIIYLNHTREGASKTRSPLKGPEIPRDNAERHSRDRNPEYEMYFTFYQRRIISLVYR